MDPECIKVAHAYVVTQIFQLWRDSIAPPPTCSHSRIATPPWSAVKHECSEVRNAPLDGSYAHCFVAELHPRIVIDVSGRCWNRQHGGPSRHVALGSTSMMWSWEDSNTNCCVGLPSTQPRTLTGTDADAPATSRQIRGSLRMVIDELAVAPFADATESNKSSDPRMPPRPSA